jgi:glycosyltransferase involved in cell wall biosynthesis
LRILHIDDAAAVSCILAKYQQQTQGHNSKVIKYDIYDKFGFYRFYRDYVTIAKSEDQFLTNIVEESKSADIIHIHTRSDVFLKLRNKFGKSKKMVLHYHGTEIRGLKKQKLPHRSRLSDVAISLILKYRKIRNTLLLKKRIHYKAQNLADAVIVSTPDLMKYTSTKNAVRKLYLPNPIDLDVFKPNAILHSTSDDGLKRGNAVTMDNEVTDIPWALEYLKKNNIDLDITVHDRIRHPLMYQDLPNFLKQYKTYVDIRYVNKKIIPALSKTALESLACGLEVLDYQLQFRNRLPEEHYPSSVISSLSKVYDEIPI